MISLGCAKNRVNSEQMMFLLRENGFYVTGEIDGADVVVVNTCGFIESAKAETIDTILELAEKKDSGGIGAIVVAGCMAERYKNELLKELPEVDAVVGTGRFDDIVDVVRNVSAKEYAAAERVAAKPAAESAAGVLPQKPAAKPVLFGDINAPISETGRIISTSPIWAYLKIADGCDNRCAYCCIPAIRGRYRSRPLENIVAEAKSLASSGYKELILVAQDTTSYGKDLYEKRSLPDLLRALTDIEGLSWIRLLYLYPDGFYTNPGEFHNELIDEIAKNGKIVKYADIPIQHINDKILRKMNRRGTGSEIRNLFNKLREQIPNIILRTSLITGLPGEGDKEFDELCDFLRETKIQRAGVFAYSPEEGTPAALMKRPPTEVAEQRAAIVQEIQAQIMDDFNESRIGNVERVIVEGAGGLARSYAEAPEVDGYIKINADNARVRNTMTDVKLTGIKDGEIKAEVINQ